MQSATIRSSPVQWTGLIENTGEARRALYDRARNALVAQLRSNKPVLVLADITQERLALEEAVPKEGGGRSARKVRTKSRKGARELQSADLTVSPRAADRLLPTTPAAPPQSA